MKKRSDRIGEESINRQGLWMRIVRYENNKRVLVEFPETGVHKWTRYASFLAGKVSVETDETPEAAPDERRKGCLITIAAMAAWVVLILFIVKWLWG